MGFLGHVVYADGIHVDPQKVEAVANWEFDQERRLSQKVRVFGLILVKWFFFLGFGWGNFS